MSDVSVPLLRTLADKADPRHSALLVIDVQNDFVADGGFFDQVGGDVRVLQKKVPRLLHPVVTSEAIMATWRDASVAGAREGIVASANATS